MALSTKRVLLATGAPWLPRFAPARPGWFDLAALRALAGSIWLSCTLLGVLAGSTWVQTIAPTMRFAKNDLLIDDLPRRCLLVRSATRLHASNLVHISIRRLLPKVPKRLPRSSQGCPKSFQRTPKRFPMPSQGFPKYLPKQPPNPFQGLKLAPRSPQGLSEASRTDF